MPVAPREQFIPLRKRELLSLLIDQGSMSAADAERFRKFGSRLEDLIHCDFHHALQDLKDAYAPFDPDADTQPGPELTPEAMDERRESLFREFSWLTERANFSRVAPEAIEQAVKDCSQWGLNLAIDFNIFDRLDIYCRGDIVGTRFRRRLRNRFRTEAIQVPVYQRLVVIFRLAPGRRFSKMLDTQDVYIKLFKDIPKLDLDMLLPGTQVKMSFIDRARILLPTLSGVSIAIWKIVQGALLVAAAGFYGSVAFLGLVGGTVGYGVRSFFGYLNTKQKYQLNLTQSLYYQNLDNNAGVIHRLLDEAEEQENREALLAYFFLWRKAPAEGWSDKELDQHIEQFLGERIGQDIDFEVSDALGKLERLKLIRACAGGKWRAVEVNDALELLTRGWNKRGQSAESSILAAPAPSGNVA